MKKNGSKGKKRLLRILLTLLLTVILTFIFALTAFAVALARVDTEGDELMFLSARGAGSCRYYVSDTEYESLSDYNPKLFYTDMNKDDVRVWYPYDELPDALKMGFIAVEDRKFFSHSGVDVRRTLLAAANCIFHFDKSFGASTITQQLIKNVSGDSERTFSRKINEIARALSIEKKHTKEEILELYINIVPMGENLVGVGSASRVFFGKAPTELSLSECATLVGITNAPTRYSPYDNLEACIGRRNNVLFCMLECGYITEDEFENASNESLSLVPRPTVQSRVSNWFVETVNDDLFEILTEKCGLSESAARGLIASGGLSVYTTMNEKIQSTLEGTFENGSLLPGQTGSGLEMSCVVCDSRNSRLLGIIGSVGKKRQDKIINHATVPHTPGSALKPLALYAPLINSRKITPATVLDDVPLSFDGGRAYPKNYPDSYNGLMTVRDALISSKNTVAIRLYNMLGQESIYKNLTENYGFDTLVRSKIGPDGKTLSDLAPSPLALGQLSYGVSLRKLTEAYTVFPAEGVRYEPTSIIAVLGSGGEIIYEYKENAKKILERESAALMNKLLSNVVTEGTARTVGLKYLVDTAGKTGTSGDDKDRLFIGYTPYYTCGIWCGYKDSDESIGKLSKTHLQVWDSVMTKIHKDMLKGTSDEKIRSFSSYGLVRCEYCKDSGELYCGACEYDARGSRLESEYFIRATEPKQTCKTHILVLYDAKTEALAGVNCPHENLIPTALIKTPKRSFPYEIAVLDGGYVYRRMSSDVYAKGNQTPYFYEELELGEYAGKSKGGKQFNCYCHEHNS